MGHGSDGLQASHGRGSEGLQVGVEEVRLLDVLAALRGGRGGGREREREGEREGGREGGRDTSRHVAETCDIHLHDVMH